MSKKLERRAGEREMGDRKERGEKDERKMRGGERQREFIIHCLWLIFL